MTIPPQPDPPRGKPAKSRALSYGVGAIGVAIGTILTAGGQAGADGGTIRLAIVVFGIIATVSLVCGAAAAWRGDRQGS